MENNPIEHRAGGIVYRKTNGQIEYLLVTSKSNPARWIFPSGHIDERETFAETALNNIGGLILAFIGLWLGHLIRRGS